MFYAVTGFEGAKCVLAFSTKAARDEYVSAAVDGGPWRSCAKTADMIFVGKTPTHWHSYAVDFKVAGRGGPVTGDRSGQSQGPS